MNICAADLNDEIYVNLTSDHNNRSIILERHRMVTISMVVALPFFVLGIYSWVREYYNHYRTIVLMNTSKADQSGAYPNP